MTGGWVRICGAYLLLAGLYSGGIGLLYYQSGVMPFSVAIAFLVASLGWGLSAAAAGIGLLFLASWARRPAVVALGSQVGVVVLGLMALLMWPFGVSVSMVVQVLAVVAPIITVPTICIWYLTRPVARTALRDSPH
jgi:hypothetical protein